MLIGLAVATVVATGANGHTFCATSRVSNSDTSSICKIACDVLFPSADWVQVERIVRCPSLQLNERPSKQNDGGRSHEGR